MAEEKQFTGHVLVCMEASQKSLQVVLGLFHFVMPLRASNLRKHELRTILFIGDQEYFRKEWKSLENFPSIYLLNVLKLKHFLVLFEAFNEFCITWLAFKHP